MRALIQIFRMLLKHSIIFKITVVPLPAHPKLSCNTVFPPSYLLYTGLFVQQVWQLGIREVGCTVCYCLW